MILAGDWSEQPTSEKRGGARGKSLSKSHSTPRGRRDNLSNGKPGAVPKSKLGPDVSAHTASGEKRILSGIGSWFRSLHDTFKKSRISVIPVLPTAVAMTMEGSEGPSLTDQCTLRIFDVKKWNAGLYRCKQDDQLRDIELSVMTVKLLSPLDSDLMRDQNMVLECSLEFCSDGVLRWIGERGKTLCTSKNICVSRLEVLPVSRVSNYTCQFVKGGTVMVEAQYTAVFTEVDAGGPEGTQPPRDPKMLLINIIRIGVSLLILYVILVVVILVKRKSSRDAGQDRQS